MVRNFVHKKREKNIPPRDKNQMQKSRVMKESGMFREC